MSGGGPGKRENEMKVTSGKLQIGDVIHWEDGEKQIVDEERLSMYALNSDANGIGFLLSSPSSIKKITRKAKERELGPKELMQGGDIIRTIGTGTVVPVVEYGGYDGMPACSVAGYGTVSQVFRPIASARISRREYKRRVKAAMEYCKTNTTAPMYVLDEIEKILKGETK